MTRTNQSSWYLVVLSASAVLSGAIGSEAQDDTTAKRHATHIDGYFTEVDETNKIGLRDGIAFWSSEGHDFTVACYPFELNREDVDTLRRDPTRAFEFGTTDTHRNPDPKRWSRTPLILLKFSFDPRKKIAVDHMTTLYVHMRYGEERSAIPTFIDRQLRNRSDRMRRLDRPRLDEVFHLGLATQPHYAGIGQDGSEPKVFVQSLAIRENGDEKVLELVSNGLWGYKDESYAWRIKLTTPVYDLPPREIVQAREWRDSTGKFSVIAGFVERNDDRVVLKKITGESTAVRIDRLSEADQLFLASFAVIDPTSLLEQQQQVIKSLGAAKTQHLIKDAGRPGMPFAAFSLVQRQAIPLAHLKLFPRVHKLLVQQEVDAAFFDNVREFRQITELSVHAPTMDQATLAALCRLSALKTLRLNVASLSDDDLSQVRTIPGLQALAVDGTKIGDRGLDAIADLKDLRYLDLRRTNITDEGMSKVASLNQLKALGLEHTAVTAVGLTELQKLGQLEEIRVGGPKFGEAEIDVLKQMTSLRRVGLRRDTGNLRTKLREALPAAEVEYLH